MLRNPSLRKCDLGPTSVEKYQIYQAPFSSNTDVRHSLWKYRTQMQGKYWNWNHIVNMRCVNSLPSGLWAIFRVGDFGVSSRNIHLQFVGELFLGRDERKRSAKPINNFILQVLSLCVIYSLASTQTFWGCIRWKFSRIIFKLIRINSIDKSRVKQWPDYEFYDQKIWGLRRKRAKIFYILYSIRFFSGDSLASYINPNEHTGEANSHIHLVQSLKMRRAVSELPTPCHGMVCN
jgi:hypothetical protein